MMLMSHPGIIDKWFGGQMELVRSMSRIWWRRCNCCNDKLEIQRILLLNSWGRQWQHLMIRLMNLKKLVRGLQSMLIYLIKRRKRIKNNRMKWIKICRLLFKKKIFISSSISHNLIRFNVVHQLIVRKNKSHIEFNNLKIKVM